MVVQGVMIAVTVNLLIGMNMDKARSKALDLIIAFLVSVAAGTTVKTSLKKSPELRPLGILCITLDTIAFLANAIISYASTKNKYSGR